MYNGFGGARVLLLGFPLRGGSTNEPSAKGEFASRPKVTRLVRYGPVRQKTNFSVSTRRTHAHALSTTTRHNHVQRLPGRSAGSSQSLHARPLLYAMDDARCPAISQSRVH